MFLCGVLSAPWAEVPLSRPGSVLQSPQCSCRETQYLSVQSRPLWWCVCTFVKLHYMCVTVFYFQNMEQKKSEIKSSYVLFCLCSLGRTQVELWIKQVWQDCKLLGCFNLLVKSHHTMFFFFFSPLLSSSCCRSNARLSPHHQRNRQCCKSVWKHAKKKVCGESNGCVWLGHFSFIS